MGFTRASWRAYKNMNGVIMPGVSAGSNQVGDKVTCTPMVNCPRGWAVACDTRQGQSVSPAAPPSAPCRSRRLVHVLPLYRGFWVMGYLLHLGEAPRGLCALQRAAVAPRLRLQLDIF